MISPDEQPESQNEANKNASLAWPIYEKDQTGAENSLEQWCDIAWGASVIPTGEARVELVLEFMREWYRNTDYDWRSFYADIATRSDLFPDESEMERFIALPALPATFDHERFFDLLDRWDELQAADDPAEPAAAEIASCGLGAEATDDARLRLNGVLVDSGANTRFPSKLDVLETVCAMQSCQIRRFPEEADDETRFTKLKRCLERNRTLFNRKPQALNKDQAPNEPEQSPEHSEIPAAPQWSSGGPMDNSEESDGDEMIIEEARESRRREVLGLPPLEDEEE